MTTRELYPEIEPYDHGMLEVGDGHSLYYEQSGNPDGKPVVAVHGGPGGGSTASMRRYFNPEKYRIVLFDQRGCGKSRPHASEPDADLSANTTWHLVADIEMLREHLGIDKWQVFGGSWGSTLSLAYAETHTDRVTELVLRGIFTLRESELRWFYQEGASHLFPDFWETYLEPIPEEDRDDLIAAYNRRLFNPDTAIHVPAGLAWSIWEASTTSLFVDEKFVKQAAEDDFWSVAFARIENHFFFNKGWMEDGQLIRDAVKLKNIPTVIVQGRYDACTPPQTAWDLYRQMPHAKFVMVPDAGHASIEPGIRTALMNATDEFASRQ
ncbi:prolyl aminopeptidase [Leucobacter sp. OH1287]|uniref:prolyl aminopeptidase n=1 Tax=Leucobacter sp. OH1287 TaxID=2491049 RepID=UPI000F5FCC73|nr:prolyl aminopeptidase [Leucobacter sp. OH1287]RRD61300.1 prolyl aminopeptidase [Leucobacter sp. OH1287]